MLVKIFCPCTRKYANVKCRRYLGEVEGKYHLRCDQCKAIIEGDTSAGWMRIVELPKK